jgi:hypothetical protein
MQSKYIRMSENSFFMHVLNNALLLLCALSFVNGTYGLICRCRCSAISPGVFLSPKQTHCTFFLNWLFFWIEPTLDSVQ